MLVYGIWFDMDFFTFIYIKCAQLDFTKAWFIVDMKRNPFYFQNVSNFQVKPDIPQAK